MRVQKRDGSFEAVRLDAVTDRLTALCKTKLIPNEYHLEPYGRELTGVDVARVATKICQDIHDGVTTAALDSLAADIACGLATEHPDYGTLAARIIVSDLHKTTSPGVVETFKTIPNLNPVVLEIAERYREKLQGWLDFSLDYTFDVFSLKTWKQMYLIGKERPQHAFLRVALGIWGTDLDNARKTYEALSRKRFTHASPTLFNSGTTRPQMASCFLMGVFEDSLDGIFGMYHDIARVSKYGGGIGLHVHGVRGKGAPIKGTNGASDGLVPMLRVANEVIRYVNQGGRRLGSMAVYLEPHHPDVLDFLDLRRNQGDEHLRARDLFTGLWIPDLFMKRVEADRQWSLFDPSACPGLDDVFGNEYDALYEKYEAQGKAVKTLKARDVWNAILRSQIETGTPYLLYKDAVNAKSNQQHLGVIKSSNLCTEIVEYTAPDEIAVCTLGSLCLPAFVKKSAEVSQAYFDFRALHAATKQLAKNLDRVIDVTFYPVPQTKMSNMRHRPIGIGVQGLQDVFFMLRMPFDSPQARDLNKTIFECMYHAALETSTELAAVWGPHPSYAGSPASKGYLQYDLWKEVPSLPPQLALEWGHLKLRIAVNGLRNSLSIAPMPTASTAQLMGNYEAFEPQTSNIFVRKTLAGDFVVVNKYLQRDLLQRGLWTPEIKDAIVAADGKIGDIPDIPDDLKRLYRTVWDLSMKTLIDMAADRGPYVCQSQSLNLFLEDATHKRLSSMHFYAWKRGLKTGVYYLRSRPASAPVKITVSAPPQPPAPPSCIACSG